MLRLSHCLLLGAALPLLAPGAARAQAVYKIEPVLKVGDTVGDLQSAGTLRTMTLDDEGRVLFASAMRGANHALLLYAGGKPTPLVIRGQEAPGGGTWALGNAIRAAMSPRGTIVLAAQVQTEAGLRWGTFLREAASGTATAVALPGMPAADNLPFESVEPMVIPQINNRDEIVFAGAVKDAAGKTRTSAFFRGTDGRLQPVALLDQAVPGGGPPIQFLGTLTLSDSGVAGFRAQRQGDSTLVLGGYLWEQGTISPVALPGGDLPGGAKIQLVTGLWLNNANRTVLVAARLQGTPARYGLYRLVEGRLIAVAAPGQELPGGSTLRLVPHDNSGSTGGPNALGDVSPANAAGQHVFRAVLEDGTRALYMADVDGKLSLLLKNGQSTELGAITFAPGAPLRLNSRGQVAMTVRIDGGPETLVLLTPAAP
jgi:hypothetical protein